MAIQFKSVQTNQVDPAAPDTICDFYKLPKNSRQFPADLVQDSDVELSTECTKQVVPLPINSSKRVLDVVLTIGSLFISVPAFLICALANFIFEGRPIFYLSQRRTHGSKSQTIIKFRTMKLDADKILNRDTVPVSDTRFLNISVNDEIFTPVGRIIEKLGLTEVPQLFQVLSGKLTLVGNRPLPENVIRSLSEIYPHAEERFIIRAGVTGPAQLVGREHLTDAERLDLEIAYCKFCTENYSLWRDVQILFLTAMIILRLRPSLKVEAVRDLITPRRGSASAKLMKEKNTD